MQLGMVGLGRMGANMVRRLMRAGHECAVQDISKEAVDGLIKEGAKGTTDLAELPKLMAAPRTICLMLPAALVDQIIDKLVPPACSRPGVRGIAVPRPGASVLKIGSRPLTTAFSPPIIMQYPRSRPQIPPLVPTST